MNIVHIIMKSVTTKEKILQVAKKEALSKGLENLGMREIAASSSVALGTLYNYFPNKEALISSTIASVWEDAISNLEEKEDFVYAVDEVYKTICTVNDNFYGFLTSHGSLLKKGQNNNDKMSEKLRDLKDYISSSMDSETKARIERNFEVNLFLDFILDNIIISVLKGERPTILEALLLKLY